MGNATDIAILLVGGLFYLGFASYCVVWCGTWAYLKAKERFLDSYQED